MGRRMGWAGLTAVVAGAFLSAQTLTNQALQGKYYFRHVSLTTDATGGITDSHSLIGAITFDGNGRYTYSGQQAVGTNGDTSTTGSGTYSVDPAGFVSMDSPVRAGDKVNARWGSDVLLGSSTESSGNVFDLFVAVRAPTSAPLLAGSSYWVTSLEFTGGNGRSARNSFFNLIPAALGRVNAFNVLGHATNLGANQPFTQVVGGATYAMAADGAGNIVFGPGNPNALLSGYRTLYVSADGNTLLGGTPGSHDIMIGIKSATIGTNNSLFNGDYWAAGLRYNPFLQPADVSSWSGSLAARGQGTLTWSRRTKALGFGAYDLTEAGSYLLSTNSAGIADLVQIGLGVGGKSVIGATIHAADPGSYEIYVGFQMPALSGNGVFLNPRGVTSAASFVPAGAPIAPGEFIALFGTGLAAGTQTAAPPYPSKLNDVTVLVNNLPAPLYYVSATQIDCLVPYATAGSTATIVVRNNGVDSNPVTVPVAPTSPGIFSQNQSGTGLGAILHTDYSPVNLNKMAAAGEAVLIFLTGMGAVDPAVPDGTAGGSDPFSQTTASPISVFVAGLPAKVLYTGLAPGYPGLYQLNVTLPGVLPGSGVYPLSIQTPNAFHSLVYIPVK